MTILLDNDYISAFITISDPNEGFDDILEDFELDLLDSLDLESVCIEKAFSTRIVLNLVGDREEILESCGIITQLLLEYGISSFSFALHSIEECDD